MANINVGDVYWIKTSTESIAHPYIVVEVSDHKVLVCGVTSNPKKANLPGNFIINSKESGLHSDSIVNVSNTQEVPVSYLSDKIGQVSPEVIEEIKKGIAFINKLIKK